MNCQANWLSVNQAHSFISVLQYSWSILISRLNIGQLCHFCIYILRWQWSYKSLVKDSSSPTKPILVQYIKTPQGCLSDEWKHSTFCVRHLPVPYTKWHLQTSLRVACCHSTIFLKTKKYTIIVLVRMVEGYNFLQIGKIHEDNYVE